MWCPQLFQAAQFTVADCFEQPNVITVNNSDHSRTLNLEHLRSNDEGSDLQVYSSADVILAIYLKTLYMIIIRRHGLCLVLLNQPKLWQIVTKSYNYSNPTSRIRITLSTVGWMCRINGIEYIYTYKEYNNHTLNTYSTIHIISKSIVCAVFRSPCDHPVTSPNSSHSAWLKLHLPNKAAFPLLCIVFMG